MKLGEAVDFPDTRFYGSYARMCQTMDLWDEFRVYDFGLGPFVCTPHWDFEGRVAYLRQQKFASPDINVYAEFFPKVNIVEYPENRTGRNLLRYRRRLYTGVCRGCSSSAFDKTTVFYYDDYPGMHYNSVIKQLGITDVLFLQFSGRILFDMLRGRQAVLYPAGLRRLNHAVFVGSFCLRVFPAVFCALLCDAKPNGKKHTSFGLLAYILRMGQDCESAAFDCGRIYRLGGRLGHRLFQAKEMPVAVKTSLAVTVALLLRMLGAYKYLGFIAENINLLFGLDIAVPEIELPIGISFFTFQILSYVIDVYRKDVAAQKTFT